MADFQLSLNRTLAHEGGYSVVKADRGGETYRGVSRRFHPSWAGWIVVDQLKHEPGFPRNLQNHPGLQNQVGLFYHQQFWQPLLGEQLVHQAVADELFDTAVNMGIATAVSFAQTALNLLNRNQSSYPDGMVDGKMGPKTLKLLNDCSEPEILVRTLNALQAARYIRICEKDPSQEVFFRGWLKRTLPV